MLRLLDRIEKFWFREVDARPYALLRILYGIVAFINVLHLWTTRLELISDQGMIDARVQESFVRSISIFWYARSELVVSVVIILAGVACLCLAAGFCTRAAAIFCYFWHLSYIPQINPGTSGWDFLLLAFGFLLMISPIDRVWSIRAKKAAAKGSPLSKSAPAYGLYLFQWQVMLLYVHASWVKLGDHYWRVGEEFAYFWLGSYSILREPIFAHLTRTSVFFSYCTLAIEIFVPFLLWQRHTRLIGFILGYALHIAILFSVVPIFSLIVMASYWAFVTGEELDQLKNFSKRFFEKFAGTNTTSTKHII